MNIAIIDDELHCIKSLEIHINNLFPESNIVFTSTKPKEALIQLLESKVDLLFLDIQMPGLNGFQLLENFHTLPFDVIFTTAYSQYAVKAFKAQAINYLLKPIDEDELNKAVAIWKEKHNQEKESDEINLLLTNLKKDGFLESKIAVPVTDGFEFLDIKDIMYCQSQNNYTYIYLENGENVLISKTLKTVENVLERFYFLRPHQSFLVNPRFMKKYMRRDGGYIVMSDNKQVPVSNSKKGLINTIFESLTKDLID